jgi:predicted SAM-dependent methyltransferase
MKKVHLGCGNKFIDGWINVDIISHPKIFKHDLRKPLPFNNDSVDFFFSEHFFEHLEKSEGFLLLKEIYRCLKPGGVSRITVPDLDLLVKSYVENNLKTYSNIGLNVKTKCDLINIGMRGWGHKYLYDKEELLLMHEKVGFKIYNIELHKKSSYPELDNLEKRKYSGEISCEAIK